MRSIKIKFVDEYIGFDIKNNIFLELLSKRYDVQFSDDPDYLFYSLNGFKHLRYQVPRIFFTQENITPDFNICDYAFGFDYLSFGDRYFRLPVYLISRRKELLALSSGQRLHGEGERLFCNFIVSNKTGAPEREEMLYLLSKYKKVDSAGAYLNNVGYRPRDKARFQSRYKFSLAFENSSSPGYITEKIVDAAYAGTIPIYWGDPTATEVFDASSFVNCRDYSSLETAAQAVIDLDRNEEKYLRMLSRNFLKKPLQGYSFDSGFEDFLFSIFEQPWKAAFRRNRNTWGIIYESRFLELDAARKKIQKSLIRRTVFRLRGHSLKDLAKKAWRNLGKKLSGSAREELEWR